MLQVNNFIDKFYEIVSLHKLIQ